MPIELEHDGLSGEVYLDCYVTIEYLQSERENFMETTIRPAILYDTKCWEIKQHVQRISVEEMRMLRWISSNMRKDTLRNKCNCIL